MTWRPSWLSSGNEEADKEAQAKKDKEEFDKAVREGVKKELEPINERLKGLDSLTAFATDYKKDKEEKERKDAAAIEAAKRKKEGENAPSKEDLAALILEDPSKVIDYVTKTQQEAILTVKASQVKQEVFGEKPEDFPYYTGEIKTEVDSLISKQTLAFQNDPVAVANTYHTIVGRKMKEISEGKIKSRFASSSGSTGGSGKSSEQTDEVKFEITPELTKAARLSGLPIDEYMKIVEKAAKAGEIEYV